MKFFISIIVWVLTLALMILPIGAGAAPPAQNSASKPYTVVVGHSVILNWDASTSPNIALYRIYVSFVNGGPYAQLGSSLGSATSYIDTSVISGQTYYYVATAVDTSGAESVYSNQVVATIP